eukprot:CAMPEP_0176369946 /NCGR_PEP_ID=MMETSP0126-20121128/23640_1 /TAXON_ID=141414 ORGANISM="Strombidinopsis acuminatum, Strain SPMC142" /NCGR_SAMPLE_ID=MMETSP0126 /ASSEMBLY_ACC=CAM_ASM_000229 /LENGTH=32 /DNA_ID= /DNA_START= /DNA_END= /DNA_ORIENTATION=
MAKLHLWGILDGPIGNKAAEQLFTASRSKSSM